MKQIRRRLTFANIVACIALFVALGSASYAATQLPKNSVGTKQIKKNAVTTAKIKSRAVTTAKIKSHAVTAAKIKQGAVGGASLADGAVSGAKLQANSITGANVQDNSLTGADIDQSSLTSVKAGNVIGVAMNADCTAAIPLPSGVSTVTIEGGYGCAVTFPFSVIQCVATATPSLRQHGEAILVERTVQTIRDPAVPDEISTAAFTIGMHSPMALDLTLVC